MLTAGQCRAARAFLKWTLPELAHLSMVSVSTINAFELEYRQPIRANLSALRRAFEAAGVEFIEDDGVRLRPNTARTAPAAA